MTTKEKLQRVLDVIDGRAHPSTLIEILPKPDVQEENILRLAVDFLVAREREKIGGTAASQFRLKVMQGNEELHVTDWKPEHSQMSVPMMMAQLRQEYPREAISVERSVAN
jgi:hypothetical protein